MKKVYIIPSCEIYNASVTPLCSSVPVAGDHLNGTNGAWSKGFWDSVFDESETPVKKSVDFFE